MASRVDVPIEGATTGREYGVTYNPRVHDEPPPVRTVRRDTVYESARFAVVRDYQQLPDGSVGTWESIRPRGEIVLVLPINAAGCVYLVDIFRPLLDCFSLEVIGGGVEAGEAPELAAARELLEETGIRGELIALGTHELSTAMFPIRQHLFLAHVETIGEPEPEPFERHTIRGLCRLPLADAVDLVLHGEILGLSSVSLILRANEHLRREGGG
ncbi:MAG: NUDIX hydrolase [Chloroflexota bacterium]|nr:NUDIX hydrolase [Chloroflexota bacterium]